MDVTDATSRFLDHRRLKLVSAGTIDLYDRELFRWQQWRHRAGHPPDIATIALDQVRAYFHYLEREHIPHGGASRRPAAKRVGLTPASIETAWRVLRACWRFLDAEGLLTTEQARFFARDRVPRPRVPEHERPAAQESLVHMLLRACASGGHDAETAARDRAIVLLLFESGLRVGELCNLCDSDMQIAEASAKVVGKGGKFRWVFWGDRTAAAIAAYLRVRSGPVGGAVPFVRGTSRRNRGGKLTRDAIRAHLKRLAASVGGKLPHSAPVHCFRHGFVHAALDAGLDISEVAQLAGHASIQTTMIYARRNKERLHKAHRRIFRGTGEQGKTGSDDR